MADVTLKALKTYLLNQPLTIRDVVTRTLLFPAKAAAFLVILHKICLHLCISWCSHWIKVVGTQLERLTSIRFYNQI